MLRRLGGRDVGRWRAGRLRPGNGPPSGRRSSTGRLRPRIGRREGGPVLLAEPEQDRAPVQPLLRALIPLAGVGLVAGEEADLLERHEGAAHPGLGEPQVLAAGDGTAVDREAVEEASGRAPEPREPGRQGEGRRRVLPAAQGRLEAVEDGAGEAIGMRHRSGSRSEPRQATGKALPLPETGFRIDEAAISGDDPSCLVDSDRPPRGSRPSVALAGASGGLVFSGHRGGCGSGCGDSRRAHGSREFSIRHGLTVAVKPALTTPGLRAVGLALPRPAEAGGPRQLGAPHRVVRRHHRVVGRQAPLPAIRVRRHAARRQVPRQRLVGLAVLEADEVVRRHRPADRDRRDRPFRLGRRRGGELRQRPVRRADEARQITDRNGILCHVGGHDARHDLGRIERA